MLNQCGGKIFFHVKMETTTRKKRRSDFYDSHDNSGFVFRKVSKSNSSAPISVDTTTVDEEPQEETEMEREQSTGTAENKKEGVCMTDMESEELIEMETTEASASVKVEVSVDTDANITESEMYELLKEFQCEVVTKKLLKKWKKVNPEVSDTEAEVLVEEWKKNLLSLKEFWEEQAKEEIDMTEHDTLPGEIARTVAEQEEWSRLLDQTQQDDPPTTSIEDRLSSASLQLQEESESRSDMEDVKKTVQHYADLLKSLDEEYNRLVSEMSEQCNNFEQQIKQEEKSVIGSRPEPATPFTLLARAHLFRTKLQDK